MTCKELSDILNLGRNSISRAIKRASAYTPSIASKYIEDRLWFGTEFNLDEVKVICNELECTRLQLIYIEEKYQNKPEVDVYTLPGTNKFVLNWKENHEIKCCNTCQYLLGKVDNTIMPQPFCKLYNRYLKNFNGKVYEDWCSSYIYLDLPKPRKWFKENAPANLNIYGETDTVNGIDKSRFMSGEECKGQPVEILDQIGFDK